MAQSRRTVVRRTDDETDPARRVSKRAATEGGDSGVHRCASVESEAVRLDENRRRHSREHRSIRRADRGRAGRTTYVTNHRDGTLGGTEAITIGVFSVPGDAVWRVA